MISAEKGPDRCCAACSLTLLTGMEIPVNIGTCRFEYAEPSGVAPPTTKRVSELTVSLFAATFLITFLAALQAVGKQEII